MHQEAGTILEEKPAEASPVEKKSPGDFWIVLGLTALSAALCFNRLWYPSLLIDECFTYWRVCGSLDQLLDTLRNDAFMPLHYELLNWIHNGFPLGFGFRIAPGGIFLTPTVIRSVSATAGTLMTPVMYFLARQIFNRRTAIIAAAFIACSAYGLFFAHFAKMYAAAWMLETLTIACFLWWLRTWTRLAWLCWIASGIAAAGFHAITMLLLPLAPLYFISMGKFRGWRVPMLIGGLLLICVGPAIYYGCYNHWTRNSGGIVPGVVGEPAPDANWAASGLDWLDQVDNSVEPSFAALNSYLSGFEWKTWDDLEHPSAVVARFSAAMIALFVSAYALFFFGALPWPYLKKSHRTDLPAQPWWRSLLWVSLWIVMPVYGFFYCRSVPDFSPPTVWAQSLAQLLGVRWFAALAGMAAGALLLAWQPRAAKFVAIPLLLLVLAAVVQTARNNLDWFAASTPAAGAIFIAVGGAVVFHYAGNSLADRSIQLLRLLGVFCVIFALCGAMFFVWTWLHEASMRKSPDLPWQPVWNTRYVAIVWPAVWLAAAALISRLPTPPLRIAAVLMICSCNLANVLARQYFSTEVPFNRLVSEIYQSQPNSNTRTYFEMHVLFDSTYYRPLALYNACLAARLEPSPGEFRIGATWPFQYGAAADWFRSRCIYNSSISSDKIKDDWSADSRISKVIVWQVSRFGMWSWNDDDAAEAGLTGPWKKVSDETIESHWYWDWHAEWVFRRMEFDR